MAPAAAAVKYTAEAMPEAPDPSRCPLCGQPNACARAAGADGAECWCMSVDIAEGALAKMPPAARDRVCVCAACARGESKGAPSARALRTVGR